jgi:hypothetical protein
VSEDKSQLAEPCLSNRQLLNQQETCM